MPVPVRSVFRLLEAALNSKGQERLRSECGRKGYRLAPVPRSGDHRGADHGRQQHRSRPMLAGQEPHILMWLTAAHTWVE